MNYLAGKTPAELFAWFVTTMPDLADLSASTTCSIMKSKFTREEFIAVWEKTFSPTAVARELGVDVRNVLKRRENIEKKGYLLPAVSNRGDVKDVPAGRIIISQRRDVNRYEIQNGVILIGSDAHYHPGHISTAHKALCNLAFDLGSKISAVILNGDILDGAQISRHPRDGWSNPPNVKQELEAIQERTADIEKAVAPGVRLMRTQGNHDARFEMRLAAQVPEYEGVAGFTLREHLPKWEDSLRIDINEDVVVIHDWHSGIHSGWNDVLKGGCTTVTGHTHELGYKAHVGFKNRIHYGIKTGMLADEDQSQFNYRKGKPGFNWRSGFAVLTWVDGLLLNPEFCAVEADGNAYFRGKQYA